MRTIDKARDDLRAALESGDLARARRALRGFPPIRDADSGLLWAELLWADRELPDRRPLAETLLDAFPERGEIVRPCAEVLVDELGGYVPGDPPGDARLAGRAADAAERCLQLRPDYPDVARALLLRTVAAARSRDPSVPEDVVEAAWEAALQAAPDDGGAWYEVALWLKYQGRFGAALGAALRARERLGDREAVLWNIGICATGCGEHEHALGAWQRLGLPATLRAGRVHVDGMARRRIRLVSDDPVYGEPGAERRSWDAELEPTSPCDGLLLETAGLGEAGERWLHDATPLDARAAADGTEVTRLPALARLVP